MIERYLLRYFLAVIDHGNFTRAAEHCNVTQPTLSLGIARLEAMVGDALFHRTNRRVDLTPAGARLAVHARGIEAQFNLAERSIGAEKSRPVFRLGIVNTLPISLTSAIAYAAARLDVAKVELVEGRARDLSERLNMTRIDAALTLLQPGSGRFVADPIHSEGYSLALPEGHMLASRTEIAAEELSDNIMIVRRQCEVLAETSRHFTARGVRPFFAARTMNDDRALGYVAAGLGITVMPDCFTAPGVRRVPLADFSASRTLAFVRRDDAEAGQALRDVMGRVFAAAGLPRPDVLADQP